MCFFMVKGSNQDPLIFFFSGRYIFKKNKNLLRVQQEADKVNNQKLMLHSKIGHHTSLLILNYAWCVVLANMIMGSLKILPFSKEIKVDYSGNLKM